MKTNIPDQAFQMVADSHENYLPQDGVYGVDRHPDVHVYFQVITGLDGHMAGHYDMLMPSTSTVCVAPVWLPAVIDVRVDVPTECTTSTDQVPAETESAETQTVPPFFDPKTYQGKTFQFKPLTGRLPPSQEINQANINKLFNIKDVATSSTETPDKQVDASNTKNGHVAMPSGEQTKTDKDNDTDQASQQPPCTIEQQPTNAVHAQGPSQAAEAEACEAHQTNLQHDGHDKPHSPQALPAEPASTPAPATETQASPADQQAKAMHIEYVKIAKPPEEQAYQQTPCTIDQQPTNAAHAQGPSQAAEAEACEAHQTNLQHDGHDKPHSPQALSAEPASTPAPATETQASPADQQAKAMHIEYVKIAKPPEEQTKTDSKDDHTDHASQQPPCTIDQQPTNAVHAQGPSQAAEAEACEAHQTNLQHDGHDKPHSPQALSAEPAATSVPATETQASPADQPVKAMHIEYGKIAKPPEEQTKEDSKNDHTDQTSQQPPCTIDQQPTNPVHAQGPSQAAEAEACEAHQTDDRRDDHDKPHSPQALPAEPASTPAPATETQSSPADQQAKAMHIEYGKIAKPPEEQASQQPPCTIDQQPTNAAHAQGPSQAAEAEACEAHQTNLQHDGHDKPHSLQALSAEPAATPVPATETQASPADQPVKAMHIEYGKIAKPPEEQTKEDSKNDHTDQTSQQPPCTIDQQPTNAVHAQGPSQAAEAEACEAHQTNLQHDGHDKPHSPQALSAEPAATPVPATETQASPADQPVKAMHIEYGKIAKPPEEQTKEDSKNDHTDQTSQQPPCTIDQQPTNTVHAQGQSQAAEAEACEAHQTDDRRDDHDKPHSPGALPTAQQSDISTTDARTNLSSSFFFIRPDHQETHNVEGSIMERLNKVLSKGRVRSFSPSEDSQRTDHSGFTPDTSSATMPMKHASTALQPQQLPQTAPPHPPQPSQSPYYLPKDALATATQPAPPPRPSQRPTLKPRPSQPPSMTKHAPQAMQAKHTERQWQKPPDAAQATTTMIPKEEGVANNSQKKNESEDESSVSTGTESFVLKLYEETWQSLIQSSSCKQRHLICNWKHKLQDNSTIGIMECGQQGKLVGTATLVTIKIINNFADLRTCTEFKTASEEQKLAWRKRIVHNKKPLYQWILEDIVELKQPLQGPSSRGKATWVNIAKLKSFVEREVPEPDLRETCKYFVDRLSEEDRNILGERLRQLDGHTVTMGSTCSGTDVCVCVMKSTFQILGQLFDATRWSF